MKKTMLIVILTLVGQMAFAAPQAQCQAELEVKLEARADAEGWTFTGLSAIESKKEALDAIESAIADVGYEDQQRMLAMVNDPKFVFFFVHWEAPANEGTYLIAVDSTTCSIEAEIIHSSAE